MKKIATISLLLVLAAFWSYPCQAGNVVYFAPDGSQISEAEYNRLISGYSENIQKSKKAAESKPLKKSGRRASISGQKAAAVKPNIIRPPQAKSPANGKISEISDSDVRQITKNMLQSINKRDPEGLIAYYAPSYKGKIKTETGELNMTRDEYLAYLEQGWTGYGFYRARQEGEKITITPDKQKATLETDVIEIASLTDGATIKLRSQQKLMFEIVDGKILISGSQVEVEGL